MRRKAIFRLYDCFGLFLMASLALSFLLRPKLYHISCRIGDRLVCDVWTDQAVSFRNPQSWFVEENWSWDFLIDSSW
jgi:hypothetical protein